MSAPKPISELAPEPHVINKLSVAIATDPPRLVHQATQTEDAFVQEVWHQPVHEAFLRIVAPIALRG